MNDAFTIRHYTPEDYPTVAEWWKGHDWPPVPEQVLPKPGIIAERDGVPLGAVWLYMSNSNGVAMMEWLVVKPDIPGRQALAIIKALVEGVEIEARCGDYGVIFTSCKQPALAKIIERCGFVETDKQMIHLLKILPPVT